MLNARDDVSIGDATRERVLASAKQLGYAANPMARALRTGRTDVVGIAVSALRHPYSVALVQNLLELTRADGWGALVIEGGQGETNAAPRGSEVPLWPVDGVIAQAPRGWVRGFLEARGREDFPIVLVDPTPDALEGIDRVGFDLASGAAAATRVLLTRGARSVFYLAPEWSAAVPEERRAAYTLAMVEAGREPRLLYCAEHSRRSARATVAALPRNELPDAILCMNDDLALGALRGLRDLGARVPEDVAVVGHDDLEEAALACPSLSTVRIPLAEVAQAAWRLLLSRIEDPSREAEQVWLPTNYVARESTGD